MTSGIGFPVNPPAMIGRTGNTWMMLIETIPGSYASVSITPFDRK